jgi:hypothetical protein
MNLIGVLRSRRSRRWSPPTSGLRPVRSLRGRDSGLEARAVIAHEMLPVRILASTCS